MGQAILSGNSGIENYTLLYHNEDGGDGEFTLSESANNFKRIGIYYFSNNLNFQNYTEMFNINEPTTNGSTLQVIYPNAGGTNFYIRCAYAHINGNQFILGRNFGISISSTGTVSSDGTGIKVYEVHGIERII
ncbi:MAG: hypothetical protein K2N51_16915 [Lachnospiraceae bacterium]|nr:hypothetical protein [Lachnospiraceae bacterium]